MLGGKVAGEEHKRWARWKGDVGVYIALFTQMLKVRLAYKGDLIADLIATGLGGVASLLFVVLLFVRIPDLEGWLETDWAVHTTDGVVADLEKRGLTHSIDTSDGMEIHAAMFKSYHTTTPNGYNLQISYNTHDTRLNLAVAVNPRRPGNK